jgi:hypothetical protein
MSQENTLYSYLKQTKRSLKKITKRRTRRQIGPVWRIDISGRGEDIRKGCRKVNVVEIVCSHV